MKTFTLGTANVNKKEDRVKKLWLVVVLAALAGLSGKAFADVQNIRISGDIRIRGYYIFGALLLLIVVLNLAVGFWIEAGPSERHRSTIDMLLAVLRQPKEGYVRRGAFFAVTMGLALFAAVKLFAWDAIHTITYTEGYCRFVVHGDAYLLDADICPSPGTVARLMAGGIGLGLSGAVALGAWWVYHHVGGPFYVAEFLSLVLFGVVALTLFSAGMVLALIELNHRFQ